MTNGIVIGLSALSGVWLGWYAIPICVAITCLSLLLERDAQWRIVLACVLFAGLGAWRAHEPVYTSTSAELTASTGAVGQVVSFPQPASDGRRILFDVSELCVLDQCIAARERVILYAGTQDQIIARGQTLRVDWKLQPLAELPSGYRRFVQSHGASASARSSSLRVLEHGPVVFERLATANQTLTNRVARLLPGDTGALATGIVTGDDTRLSDEAVQHFRDTGSAHITSVSGQNVTIILGFLSMWWQPRSPLGRTMFHLMLALLIWSYAALVGLEPPALRAAVVATLTIMGSHVGRRPDPVTLLALTLGGIALLQPGVVHGTGFWLSATASMALCLALPHRLPTRAGKSVFRIALGPVAASLATMPIMLMTFGTWSPVSVLANILIAPVVTMAFWVTYPFALVSLTLPGVAALLTWLPGIVLDVVLVIVTWLGPLAGSIRVDAMTPSAMLMLCLPIGAGLWLVSAESDRWIRHVLRRISERAESSHP